jgi:hypothetical protein
MFYLASNAYFDGANWHQDNGAQDSQALIYDYTSTDVKFAYAPAGFVPQPMPWTNVFIVGKGGVSLIILNGPLDMHGFPILNLGAPVDGNSAVSKSYVDALTPGEGLLTLFPKQVAYGSPTGGIDQSVNFQFDFTTDTLTMVGTSLFQGTTYFGSGNQSYFQSDGTLIVRGGGQVNALSVSSPTFYDNPTFTGSVQVNGNDVDVGNAYHRVNAYFGAGDQAHFDTGGSLFTNQPSGYVAVFEANGLLAANGNLTFDGSNLGVGGNFTAGGTGYFGSSLSANYIVDRNTATGPKGSVLYKASDGSMRSGVIGYHYYQIGPIMIAWGEIIVPNPGGDGWQYFGHISFPVTFSDVPVVMLTATSGQAPPDSPQQGLTLIDAISTTDFDGWLHAGTNPGGNMLCYWLAVGLYPTA